MKKIVTAIAVGALLSNCAELLDSSYTVRNAETAIRIGVHACVTVEPPRNAVHAYYLSGIWRVSWRDGKSVVWIVDVNAATGVAGVCSFTVIQK